MIRADHWKPSDGFVLEPNALAAATQTEGNLALTAGPGAGKTEMLAQRADFLLRTGSCRYPKRILAISFKVDASTNLKTRVRRRCGHELAARFDSFTFHGFALRIIQQFRLALVGQDALDADFSVGPARVQGQSITFSDMIPLAKAIVERSAIARNALRKTYSHLFLDEFQDCTDLQYGLIKACFLGTGAQLVAVGDVKQSIMGFAGAMDGIFEDYAEDFQATTLHLYQNFRSAPVLRRMQNAMVKVMDADAAVDDADIVGEEGEIEVLHFQDDAEEATMLAARIQAWIDAGVDPSEIAILISRREDLYGRKLRQALRNAHIAFRIEDQSQNIGAEPACVLLTDLLLVTVGGPQPEAFKRLLDLVVYGQDLDEDDEYRARGKWSAFVDETRKRIKSGQIDLADRDELASLAEELISALGRETVVALTPEYARAGRLEEVIATSVDLLHEQLAAEPDAVKALKAFSTDRAVRVMTVHKSKGLEFGTVIVLGVEDQTFRGNADTERRVFFVACSRAKERLVLTTCSSRPRPPNAGNWFVNRTPYAEFLAYAVPGPEQASLGLF
ncbi:MAG: ATP-dependent helicase [Mesorhizobium sp.]|uniref:UvrD-helicase domain-containing protein n=1 Tax=Mesorhizobium sp. TaxID=1871066 RepID=UPI000FE64766|nr:ATP-dependent helicase [Mesorhizobium sp.]RWM04321.1 MAG: ATP-dependent helicase [Mesorhizobium sp.]TIP51660.1 MAG: ATP-dependent helicase [Mesorhizobium sp.]